MELIILGEHSKDKGGQLETLTKRLLKELGYTNIITNEIATGGSEIDVSAEYSRSSLGGSTNSKLLCECKAHQRVINTTDWLKFLGKIFSEEVNQQRVEGCMIALSGANGNVKGHYNDLKSKRPDISLITGEQLFEQLDKVYNLTEIENIIFQVKSYTDRIVTNTKLGYYENKVFWIISFKNEEFTLLSSTGGMIDNGEVENLKSLIIAGTSNEKFIDLSEEKRAIERKEFVEKYVFTLLLISGTARSVIELLELYNTTYKTQEVGELSIANLQDALSSLEAEKLAVIQDEKWLIASLSKTRQPNDVVLMYRYLLHNYIIRAGIEKASSYSDLIDQELLESICEIQGNLKIPEDKKDVCIKILKYSPTALGWALMPDSILVYNKDLDFPNKEEIDENNSSYFLKKLTRHLVADYKNQGLHEYIFQNCGLLELESQSSIKVKNGQGIDFELQTNERLALAELEAVNGSIVLLRVFDKQKEPWEWKQQQKPEQ